MSVNGSILPNPDTYASAFSKLSLKTAVTLPIISKLSVARVKIRCAACVAAILVWCVGLPAVGLEPGAREVVSSVGRLVTEVAGEEGVDGISLFLPPLAFAHRAGRRKINALTVERAGSGNAPPAYLVNDSINKLHGETSGNTYLDITSTTSRMVLITSRRTSVRVRIACVGTNAFGSLGD